MKLPFCKYQGTGNDFIMIDNRTLHLPRVNTAMVRQLCDRRFGIGGDGLIYLQDVAGYDFEMVYFNSDGRESTMCGNGGRCIVQFAHDLGLGAEEFSFLAVDGPHRGRILADGRVSLQMRDVTATFGPGDEYILDTGSPHIVHFVANLLEYPVASEGRRIRNSDKHKAEGINVNFAEELSAGSIFVRTYERGVEDETLSCGTGVVASAIAYSIQSDHKNKDIAIQTPGGGLHVKFRHQGDRFTDIWLTGPAERVFEGTAPTPPKGA